MPRVEKMAKPNKFIQRMNHGAGPKKGALHRQLGIPAKQKIPAATLSKAAKAPGTLGKRARLAEAFKGMSHLRHATKRG